MPEPSNQSSDGSLRSAQASMESLLGDVDSPEEAEPAEEPESEEDLAEEDEPTEEGQPDEEPESEDEVDPDAEDDADDDEDSATEEDDSEDDAEDDDSDPTYEIQGENVTLSNLKNGYLRQQDYTRKTQELAENRKQFNEAAQQQVQTIKQERERLKNEREQMQRYMQEFMPQEPDWNALYQQDPSQYAAQREIWRTWQDRRNEIDQKLQQERQANQQQTQQASQQKLQQEMSKLTEALPEWKDTEKAQDEKRRLLEWAPKAGYSQEELSSVVDHRDLITARKAMLYDELMERQGNQQPKSRRKKSPKTAKPGAKKRGNAQSRKANNAKKRAKRTGKVQDAAAWMEQMLPDD